MSTVLRAVARARRQLRDTARLRRSTALLAAFRVERTDPAFFYRTMADDAISQIQAFADIAGTTVVDVGGGPGYFRSAFTQAGATYIAIEYDDAELYAADLVDKLTIRGSGTALPLRTGSIDICFSSNVLEHVNRPETMGDEMIRVTRSGGLVYLAFTLWLSPWGGHETSPWHFLGGHYAARRYRRKNGQAPKNRFGSSLFALSAHRMLEWAKEADSAGTAELVAAFPRYSPWWVYWLTLIPVLREFATWNLVLVLRKQ